MTHPSRLVPSLVAALALTACASPPAAPLVTLQPESPTTTDALSLSVDADPADADEEITFDITWYADGAEVPELSGATEVPADRTSKNQEWRAVVMAVDAKERLSGATEATAVIVNSAPTAEVSIEPSSPGTNDDLKATAIGDDADDDDVSFTYTWLRDGDETGLTGETLSADETAKGETWTVRATPSDEDGDGEPAEASVGIDNTAPTGLSVAITPSEAYEDTTLFAEPQGEDEDGDELSWTYEWTVNGEVVTGPADETLEGNDFSRGDSVQVTATPNDGTVDGESVTSEPIVILNSAPDSETTSLTPDPAYETSTLTCAGQGYFDLDGDAPLWQFAWQVNGADLKETTETLTGAHFDKGDEVTCTAAPFDGDLTGDPVRSPVVTIANTPPTLASAAITPSSPKEADTLSVVAGATDDADGDDVELLYAWQVDGKVVGAGATIDGGSFDKGQKVQVTVTPFDGTDKGTPVTSAVVTVVNTAPVVSSVTLSPTSPRTKDAVKATVKAVDADGDKLSYEYSWFVNGKKVSATGATLDGAVHFDKGDSIYVQVIAKDGTDASAPVKSGTIKAVNSKPTIASVAVSPRNPREGSRVTAAIVGAADDDGDKITYRYAWSVNGKIVSTASSITGSVFDKGDSIIVKVTPYDGSEYGTPVSSTPATVDNTPPYFRSTTLNPNPAYTNTSLTAGYSAFDDDGDKITATYLWHVNRVRQTPTTATLSSSLFKKGDSVYAIVRISDGTTTNDRWTPTRTISNSTPSRPGTPGLSPSAPQVTQNLVCSTGGSTDADGDRITYQYRWVRNGTTYGTYSTTSKSHTLSASATAAGQKWTCQVRAGDGSAWSSWSPNSATRTILASSDGQVRRTNGVWVDVTYERCGSGTTCRSTDARAACTKVGRKVASHASNGSSSVYSLGASKSCYWSASYFKVNKTMPSGACLVGVSNLDWSSCCTPTRWHGNTMRFGAAGKIFGYVSSNDTGYVGSYSNTSGSKWGCVTLSTAATNYSGCTSLYVACVK